MIRREEERARVDQKRREVGLIRREEERGRVDQKRRERTRFRL